MNKYFVVDFLLFENYEMTPKQKYLLDLNGYLHIPAVLTSNQLKTAQLAVDRYIPPRIN